MAMKWLIDRARGEAVNLAHVEHIEISGSELLLHFASGRTVIWSVRDLSLPEGGREIAEEIVSLIKGAIRATDVVTEEENAVERARQAVLQRAAGQMRSGL